MRTILMLMFASLFFFACNRDKCENGFECVEGVCVCPEGNFQYQGICRQLEPGEYWGAINCHCVDTLFMKLRDTVGNIIHYSIVEPNKVTGFGSFNFEEHWTGNAINANYFATGKCIVEGRSCVTRFYGRFIGTDTIQATIKFVDTAPSNPVLIDECTAILHR